jgi:hypothetical protein
MSSKSLSDFGEKTAGELKSPTRMITIENTQRLAVKIIRLSDDEELMDVAYNEYKLLRNIQHENIV